MASNAEMLRLVQHAADLLDDSRSHTSSETVIAAMAYASAILSMVASCIMDDPAPPDPLGPLLATLTDGTSYTEWADSSPRRGIPMADTELDAVARFLEAVSRGQVG